MELGTFRLIESLVLEAIGLTTDDLRMQLRMALKAGGTDEYSGPWLVAVMPGDGDAGQLVYEQGGKYYRCGYSISLKRGKRSTMLDMDKAVQVIPRSVFDEVESDSASMSEALTESATFCEELKLAEAAQADYLIKVIAPGQGSSAFYPEAVLKRDGPKVFRAGTHMYWNHPTATEESERPEGDLEKLAAVLTTNAYWDANGPKGQGLYARAKVFADYAEQVQEKGKHIGVSIRAYGVQDAEGNLTELTAGESVDFVTKPGAGGAVLTESAGAGATNREESDMDKAEIQALITESVKPIQDKVTALEGDNTNLKAENKALREAQVRGKAREFIAGKVKAERLPEAAKLRVVDSVLLQAIPVTESGELDEAKLGEAITKAVKAEADYLSGIVGGGQVLGLGEASQSAEIKPEEFKKQMKEFALRSGMSEKEAEIYAEGRQ